MRKRFITMALLAVIAAPAGAQDAEAEYSDITCGDFLALDANAQMSAMLELRTAYSGDSVSASEEVDAATVVTGATEAGAEGSSEAEPPAPPQIRDTPEAKQRLSGMRTSCQGVTDIPAVDALIAAHADYNPVFEVTPPAD